MNNRVNIEIAKLLKEKGWDIDTYSNCWLKTLDGDIIHNSEKKNIFEHERCEVYLMQPTIFEVVIWLYEKYSIWVTVSECNGIPGFYYRIKQSSGVSFIEFSSPIECYEAGIKYTLNNLI